MAWYEHWFGSDAYEIVYEHRDLAEAEQLVDLVERAVAPHPRATILDVGCGRGRHARILARRGFPVIGVDLSETAIAEARALADDAGLDVDFRVGDMRDPICEACVDGVVNLFTAFGYFDDDAENQRALRAMSTALRPGGWLVQDFLNAPQVVESLVPEDTRTVDGVTIHQKRWIEDGRVHKQITLDDGDATETHRESVRLFTYYDLKGLYADVGLDVIDAFGSYDGATYTPSSPRLILHATKSD